MAHARHHDASDDELVERARVGDRAAYGELVRRHQTTALLLAAGICGSTEEARDIVQDRFVQGYRSLGQFRDDAPVRSWLLRVVANHAKNAVRTSSRRRQREDRSAALDHGWAAGVLVGDPVGELALAADETSGLLAAWVLLPEHDREMLACRYLADLSEVETAVALGVPVGTVESRASRALTRARAALGEAADG